MKKTILVVSSLVAALVVLTIVGVSVVNAQGPTPQTPGGFGRGMMMGGNQPMHEYMEEAVAEKLGISEEDLEAQYAQGLTMWQIAEAQGLTTDEITTLLTEARSEALAQMVADGVITQEQADWMESRSGTMMGAAGARGGCPMFDGQTGQGGWGRGRRGGMMNGGSW